MQKFFHNVIGVREGLAGLAILALLQADNLMPQREIAERVHLSPAAVQRRIQRLRESGVIAANAAMQQPGR